MISIILVILVNLLREERYSVANEEMCNVHRQRVIDAALAQFLVDRLVMHYVDIIVSKGEKNINRMCYCLYLYQNSKIKHFLYEYINYLFISNI